MDCNLLNNANKLLKLCIPLLETADFYVLTQAKNQGEYLSGALKYVIDQSDPLYEQILLLVPRPSNTIPESHRPFIKILKYNVGAKADLHIDNCKYGTSIIMLEASEDLQGGETYIKTSKFEIVDMKPGEFVYHPKGRIHGVSEVTKGHRHVLVLVW